MTEKELDKIIESMNDDQLKAYAKIGFIYSFNCIKKVIMILKEKG